MVFAFENLSAGALETLRQHAVIMVNEALTQQILPPLACVLSLPYLVAMKVNITIDCTPAEARAFFGLPDLAPMQEKMLAEMQQKMADNLKNMDAEALFKMWLPSLTATQSGMEQMQKLWQQFGAGPFSNNFGAQK